LTVLSPGRTTPFIVDMMFLHDCDPAVAGLGRVGHPVNVSSPVVSAHSRA
jgi:hypothetical protein